MPIKVRCPQGHPLAVAEKYAGRRVQCPQCQSRLVVPDSNGSAEVTLQPPPLPQPAHTTVVTAMAAPPVAATRPAAPPIASGAAAAPALFSAVVELPAGVQGYRADRARVLTVYWLAAGLVALVLFQLTPVFTRLNPATAPDWARWVMMLALVQLALIVWMTSLPDWSTVRVMMFALAGVATLYCVALGIAVITPPAKPLLLEMDDVREKVRLWCAAVLLMVCLMTYLSGHIGFRWRKAYWTGT